MCFCLWPINKYEIQCWAIAWTDLSLQLNKCLSKIFIDIVLQHIYIKLVSFYIYKKY